MAITKVIKNEKRFDLIDGKWQLRFAESAEYYGYEEAGDDPNTIPDAMNADPFAFLDTRKLLTFDAASKQWKEMQKQ